MPVTFRRPCGAPSAPRQRSDIGYRKKNSGGLPVKALISVPGTSLSRARLCFWRKRGRVELHLQRYFCALFYLLKHSGGRQTVKTPGISPLKPFLYSYRLFTEQPQKNDVANGVESIKLDAVKLVHEECFQGERVDEREPLPGVHYPAVNIAPDGTEKLSGRKC